MRRYQITAFIAGFGYRCHIIKSKGLDNAKARIFSAYPNRDIKITKTIALPLI